MPIAVIVPIIGNGSNARPFRAIVPSHELIAIDYVAKTAVVLIPDLDEPPFATPSQLAAARDPENPVPVPLGGPAQRLIWRRRMRERYPSRPETAESEPT